MKGKSCAPWKKVEEKYGTAPQNIGASSANWTIERLQEPQVYAFSMKTVVALRQHSALITHLEIIQTNCTVHWSTSSLLFGLKNEARKLFYILLGHGHAGAPSLCHINVVGSSVKLPQYYTDVNQDKNSD
ncbi:hypothetical protein H5410_009593 [Solanum commersonii]|uniref:Uncharacterized protein n=1 Tax=Solanum commersonii TaxID=4109 RepID=A0A9J6AK28_SOLCO|nr:hypothetical protein H5410_009593 [Solanum commersonii]